MSKFVTSWNSLETIGSKGRAFKQTKDYTTPTTRFVLKYASIAGLILGILSMVITLRVIG